MQGCYTGLDVDIDVYVDGYVDVDILTNASHTSVGYRDSACSLQVCWPRKQGCW